MSVEIHKLDNGVTVLLDHIPHSEAAAVGYFFRVGSRFEDAHENGLAHNLEHLAFKGTDKRNVHELAIEMDDLGAVSNAFTSHEGTCYFMSGAASDVLKFNEILGDMSANMALPKAEIERERGAILEEIKMYADDAGSQCSNLLFGTAFPDQAYGQTILGPSENIKSFQREDFEKFRQKHYHTGNLVVSVSGKFNKEAVLKEIEKTTANIPAGNRSTYEPAVYKGGEAQLVRPEDNQVNLCLAFKASAADGSKEQRAEILLAKVLSGGMSSRLFKEIREKRGLVYGVGAYPYATFDNGMFIVQAGTSPEKVQELMPVLCDEISKISKEKVSKDEFQRALKKVEVSVATGGESTAGRMRSNALAYNQQEKIRTDDEIIALFNEVSRQDILDAAKRVFSTKPTLVSVGPHSLPTKRDLKNLKIG
ncbi:MAG: insulinase family protein [Alphaproteobacteria bacterium]|nr:insulinase family protein [Alphaproteobacteria bacterium]